MEKIPTKIPIIFHKGKKSPLREKIPTTGNSAYDLY